MLRRNISLMGLAIPVMLAGIAAWAGGPRAAFDHAAHTPLFPGSCTTCHQGAAEPGASFWPSAERCAACHNGEVQPIIVWAPPAAPGPSILRFTHDRHAVATSDSVRCVQCHTDADRGRSVFRRLVGQCIGCHVPGGEHLSLGNDRCATCHLPLAEATQLSAGDVARFPVPTWHLTPGFGLAGHAKLAPARGPDGRVTIAASCATCHARDFCINCHVNAPEVPAIRALAPDERSLLHGFTFGAPPSHSAENFGAGHGREARRNSASCATCHTQPSCATCHAGTPLPKPVAAMHQPGPGRAAGAQLLRVKPGSHGSTFRERHGREASAAPRPCTACHAQADCLACHRANPAQPAGGGDYHPAGFLVRHPSAAYARQTTCSDCHNPRQFCVSCHAQAGLNAGRPLGSSSFHDGQSTFIVGHGQAARQSLESCVSCHVERDCTACHSSVGRGFRFNPHGPGFQADRLRRRNPEMCIACHGRAIPGFP